MAVWQCRNHIDVYNNNRREAQKGNVMNQLNTINRNVCIDGRVYSVCSSLGVLSDSRITLFTFKY